MNITVSNQPKKGDVYFGVRLYKDGKYIGSHNGITKTKRIQWFVKDFFDIFIDELKVQSNSVGVDFVIETKTF